MSSRDPRRDAIRSARERLDEWTYAARDQAYEELFEGDEPALTDDELALLDRVDSDLFRRGGTGLWGADEYGVVAAGPLDADPRVVCTYHPAIPEEGEGFRGADDLDSDTRERFNDVLWDYCERVATLMQDDLEAYLESTRE